jgi:spore maturation protein CgeB
MARDGKEMEQSLRDVINDRDLAGALASAGLETIRNRHTCAHRVDQLLSIYEDMRPAFIRQEPTCTPEVSL